MSATFKRRVTGGGLAALMLLSGSAAVQAVTTIKVTVTIVAPPPCVINGDSLIEVDFGNEVMTTRIDGESYKKQAINYTVECKDAPSNAMKLQIQGNGAGFNSDVLQTSKGDLGIKLLRNGNSLPLNEWINFTYPTLPRLEAVLIKKAGATLAGGAFSAGATMKVEYQ